MRTENPRIGITTVECLLLTIALLGGLIIGGKAAERFGWLGVLIGVPIGFIGTLLIFWALALVFAVAEGLWSGGIPYLPRCRSGRCRSGLLTDFGDFEPEERDGNWGYFRCRCGDLYERRRKDRKVLLVADDGSRQRYMKWKRLRGWTADTP